MSQNIGYPAIGAEFMEPPADPMALLREWFALAFASGVREPGAIALATVAKNGLPTSRMIQLSRISDRGLIFATHARSRKGRDIWQTGRWSGVMYWRETNQQITFSGNADTADEEVADDLWKLHTPEAQAMSAATRQSEPLHDEQALLSYAQLLVTSGEPVPRPHTWVAYELLVTQVEFWQNGPDGVYRRLRYDLFGSGWAPTRLQP